MVEIHGAPLEMIHKWEVEFPGYVEKYQGITFKPFWKSLDLSFYHMSQHGKAGSE